MKIGIITFHRSLNYGAVLQAYALQKVFERVSGSDCEIIDYINQRMRYEFSPFIKTIPAKQSKQISRILKIPYIPLRIIRICKFKKFIKKHVKQTRTITNQEQLRDASKQFDLLITGSDQVWNPVHTDFDKAYFLKFADDDSKKNSYAASFGFESVPDELRDEYCTLLKSFNNISVREKQGREIVRKLLGIEVPVVLDPTLLIKQQDWRILYNGKKTREQYILLYTVGGNISEVIKFAEKLSKEKGMQIIWVRAFIEITVYNCKKIYTADPKEWITLFFDASYIVTNTFHGTAFSINFNKQFYAGLKPPPVINNSRITNILELFGLESRIINEDADLSQEIDYIRVNEILEDERKKSKEFLEAII